VFFLRFFGGILEKNTKFVAYFRYLSVITDEKTSRFLSNCFVVSVKIRNFAPA
jgi:hypothetical protein